jgi:hypothetical protein
MDPHEDYFRSLSREEIQLLQVREILYEGSWEEMLADLEARRDGKPFVIKLKSRIEDDIRRIGELRKYERDQGVNLGKFLSPGHHAAARKAR